MVGHFALPLLPVSFLNLIELLGHVVEGSLHIVYKLLRTCDVLHHCIVCSSDGVQPSFVVGSNSLPNEDAQWLAMSGCCFPKA